MNNAINKINLIYLALLAFVFYGAVNFIYFPIDLIFPDEHRFIGNAITFADNLKFSKGEYVAGKMPIMAIIYGAFYFISSSQEMFLIITRIAQSLLLILQAFIIYKISFKIFKSTPTAKLTFVVFLFYPYFVFYQALLLSETIFNTFLVVSFYFIYCWREYDFKINKYFLLANLFLILSLYTKGTLTILPPFLLAGFYFFSKFKIITAIKIFIYSILIFILLMSIWWIRNYIILDKFVAFTTTSGYNLYLGNNIANKNAGVDWGNDVQKDFVKEVSNIKGEVEKNQAYQAKAMEFIKQNPQEFFRLALLKLKRFYSIIPNAPAFSQGKYKWISIFSYGIIFVLFLISIIVHIRHWQKLSAIYILFIYMTLIHTIAIASLRYRLPLEPFMILLAIPMITKTFKLDNHS